MRLVLENKFSQNLPNLMRACGYRMEGARDGQENFTRLIGRNPYPHFHIYVGEYNDERLVLNLHLDQKGASYSGQTAHSGEYGNELVEGEGRRLTAILRGLASD